MDGPLARWLILYLALGISILLQEIALRLRARESTSWWVSNGRDVANALALGLLLLAIRWGAGASWHIALLIGASITLFLTALARALYGLDHMRWVVVSLAGSLLILPLAWAPEGVLERTEAVVRWLVGG